MVPFWTLQGLVLGLKVHPAGSLFVSKKGTMQSPVGAFKCNLGHLDVNSVWKHFTLSQ